jgi:hypothetical protein
MSFFRLKLMSLLENFDHLVRPRTLLPLICSQTLGIYLVTVFSSIAWTIYISGLDGPRSHCRADLLYIIPDGLRQGLGWSTIAQRVFWRRRTLDLASQKVSRRGGEFQGMLWGRQATWNVPRRCITKGWRNRSRKTNTKARLLVLLGRESKWNDIMFHWFDCRCTQSNVPLHTHI